MTNQTKRNTLTLNAEAKQPHKHTQFDLSRRSAQGNTTKQKYRRTKMQENAHGAYDASRAEVVAMKPAEMATAAAEAAYHER